MRTTSLPRAAALAFLATLIAGCGSASSTPGPNDETLATGTPAPSPAPAPAPAPTAFFADPDSVATAWVAAHPTDGRRAEIQSGIVSQPAAKWITGSTDVATTVASYVGKAAAAGKVPLLVAYDIPGRDCGQYSAGGAASSGAYRTWIATFAAAVGTRTAVVVLEPDALAQLDCLPADDQADRLALLSYATAQFKSKAPSAKVYLDIGHDGWLAASVAAQRLQQAGIADARGFSLNVSNFKATADETSYGQAVASLLAQAGLSRTFVIDTSRNGNGPLGSQWCDPAGRKIGTPSTAHGDATAPEMSLWIKNPGVADGCAAAAGTFDPDLAYHLVRGT